MLELYIIRHGLADKHLEQPAEDAARPLTKEGKGKMKEIAKGLKTLKISFDQILTSPLVRAEQTAEIVHDLCGNSSEVMVTDLLKPGSSYENLVKYLNKLKMERVAIVGHEPFLSGFASYCLTNSKSSLMNLKKGGILMLEIDGLIKPGQCLLSWLMEPGQLVRLSKTKVSNG